MIRRNVLIEHRVLLSMVGTAGCSASSLADYFSTVRSSGVFQCDGTGTVCTVMLLQRAEIRKTFDKILYQEIAAEFSKHFGGSILDSCLKVTFSSESVLTQ
jgi:hypothetical protein